MNAVNNSEEERREVEDLLPWHAAGTLSRRDAQRVEDALAHDSELARRYALVRDELADTIHLNETLGAPSARAMEKLFARIDAEPARKPAVSLNLGARVSEFFASLSPRTLAWSASAAAIAILLQAGLIAGVVIKEKRGGYETASATAPAAAAGSLAIVRFAPQATAADVNAFLETNKLSIVGGPSAGGVYRVRISAKALPKAERDELVRKLQTDKVVGFIATTE